jgi:prepilin-type N-terminal cleavage/methylation domain-containing protein
VINLSRIKQFQRGFTLIEILAALAITAVISTILMVAITQVVQISSSTANRQIAIKQVENGVHYISRNSQMAQSVIPLNNLGEPIAVNVLTNEIVFDLMVDDILTVSWQDWDTQSTLVEYCVNDGVLVQKITLNKDKAGETYSESSIANRISEASGNWNTDAKYLTITLTSSVGGTRPESETRTVQIRPFSVQ